MIEVQLKNLTDFKKLVNGQKTVFVKKNPDKFTYYVISDYTGVGIINVFESTYPLKFSEDFSPGESEGINVGSLVEIESISVYGRVLYERKSTQ